MGKSCWKKVHAHTKLNDNGLHCKNDGFVAIVTSEDILVKEMFTQKCVYMVKYFRCQEKANK